MEQITPEIQKKFDEAKTLLDKIHVLLDDMKNPEVLYNKLPEAKETIDDIAVVQCFYGTNIARIRATTQALEFNLQMTTKPSTWVFVECQKKKSDCAFGWLRQHGVKHIFVPMKSENEGILLKNSLWNIGAENCKESRLCFLDSDVVMCNSDWVRKTSFVFDEKCADVVSLASHQYYQMDGTCKLHETIGYKWVTTGKADGGHCGFTIGITRQAFEKIGRFDPAIMVDDVLTFRKIFGDNLFKYFERWVKPFSLPKGMENGYNIELSYVENIACHMWHGEDNKKYDEVVKLLVKSGIKSLDDILNLDGQLPAWRDDTGRSIALKNVISSYFKDLASEEIDGTKPTVPIELKYDLEMQKILGSVDEKHPLFVCTVVKDGFGLKFEKLVAFRDMVEDKFNLKSVSQPIVMFFTDCKKFDFKSSELNVVQLKSYDPDAKFDQCLRKELKFPKNTVIYYIPFDSVDFDENIWVPDERIDNSDGTILITR